jgi:hypothetical protein
MKGATSVGVLYQVIFSMLFACQNVILNQNVLLTILIGFLPERPTSWNMNDTRNNCVGEGLSGTGQSQA